MDANVIKLFSDAGTVAIVVYVLVMVLRAYVGSMNRVIDLLEDEKSDEGEK